MPDDTVPVGQVAGLDKSHLEAYHLMLSFYTDPAYYNSSPKCRPADNVLMAIQYVLDNVTRPAEASTVTYRHFLDAALARFHAGIAEPGDEFAFVAGPQSDDPDHMGYVEMSEDDTRVPTDWTYPPTEHGKLTYGSRRGLGIGKTLYEPDPPAVPVERRDKNHAQRQGAQADGTGRPEFSVGERVCKIEGYAFGGGDALVLAAYRCAAGTGPWRYVVEHPEGWQHIFSGKQLARTLDSPPSAYTSRFV